MIHWRVHELLLIAHGRVIYGRFRGSCQVLGQTGHGPIAGCTCHTWGIMLQRQPLSPATPCKHRGWA